MKKKILIIVAVLIVVLLSIFGYLVYTDIQQEEKLRTELDSLNELANAENIDMNAINVKLEQTVTRGDYAVVEQAFKQYLKDNFDTTIKIAEILNDERLVNIVTPENYIEDGKEFTKTKEYIASTREELERCKADYSEFFTEEKAMSYINDKGLDSYYTDLYKQELVGDIESGNEDQIVTDSIDDIIEILNISEGVIDFLIANADNWEVEDGTILFSNESLSSQYDQLIEELQ